jgi:hypothetical protein
MERWGRQGRGVKVVVEERAVGWKRELWGEGESCASIHSHLLL